MVNSINGMLTFKSPVSVGIETGGIEWEAETTNHSLSTLPSVGQNVRIFTYLNFSQDALRLYGFASRGERSLFLALISVSGVGPSLARKILSGTSPDSFTAALEGEDIDLLSSIPGLGRKTAQKIVLQLRGKLTEDQAESPDFDKKKDVVDALTSMGFDAKGAAKAVQSISQDQNLQELSGEEQEREVLRRAIILLSSG